MFQPVPLVKEANCEGERQRSSGFKEEASKGTRWIT